MNSRSLSSLRRDIPAGDGAARWPVTPVLVALAAGWLLFAWPWLLGYVTIPWDAKAQFQPQIQFLAHSLARGESPFWNPYVFAGHPQIADPQSMIFSPPFLALALFNSAPSLRAVDATVFLTILLGACALALWFRDRGWHWAGAIIAGLCFMFGAAMSWRIQHTGQVLSLAYWPIALVTLERALARRSCLYAVAAGIAGAAMILGRDQVALIGIYLLAALVLARWLGARSPAAEARATLGPLLTGLAVTITLIAVPVTLTALMAADSNRPSIDYAGAVAGSLHPALLITAIIPQLFGPAGHMADFWGPPSFAWGGTGLYIAQNMGQLYIGAAPLLLLAWAALSGRLWTREIRFFVIAIIVVLLYALGGYTPVFRLFYEVLPGVAFYRRPADAVFFAGALAAILAGYATHRRFTTPWEGFKRGHIAMLLVGLAAATAFAMLCGLRFDRLARVPGPLLTAAASFGAGAMALAFAAPRIALQPWIAALVLGLVGVIDLSLNNGPSSSSALPPATYAAMQPGTLDETVTTLQRLTAIGQSDQRRDRIELVGLGFHWPNVSISQRLENTLGYNPLRQHLYSQATGAIDTVGLMEQRKFSPLFPSYRSRLADLLGLRYIAASRPLETIDKNFTPADLPIIARTNDAIIYENPRASPRVGFATGAQQADFARMLETGAWPDPVDDRTVVLEQLASAGSGGAPGTARIVSYRNTEIVIDAASPGGGYVVLRDLWHPWWFAEIDGAPADIIRADVLFRAVAVGPGPHRVRFRFRPFAGALGQMRQRFW